MAWTSTRLEGVALLHNGKQDGENSFSSDPLRDWRLEFYLRYLAAGWGFSPGDRQSWAEVDVLYGSLCWTWPPAWIKYGSWKCCSTLFGNNNILLRVISLRLRVLASLTPSFFLFCRHKQTHTDLHFQGWENATLPLPVSTEARGREKKEGGGRDGIKSIRFDGMVM